LINFKLFQNCPLLFPALLFTSPVPHAHVLQIFLNRIKPSPTSPMPSGLTRVSFLQESSSCIRAVAVTWFYLFISL
jgi:hypothetical protein